jgi:iron(III) transport system substrate-binding protein
MPMSRLALAVGVFIAAGAHAQEGQLNVICSVQAEWCSMAQTVFARTTGINVRIVHKGSGEALAQLVAERSNPKADLWFGGTGDPHLEAAEQGLTQIHRSPQLPHLHAWAQAQAAQSGYRTVGIYSGLLGFAYNREVLVRRKLAPPRAWADLVRPQYRGHIHVASPASSGTAYTMVATLVQLMGEDRAFAYMQALHRNVHHYTRTGVAPIKAVARGEAAVSISFLHDGPGEKLNGFPVETVVPNEGTGAEIGSMSIVSGARNLDNAKRFYEWALTPQAQQFAAAAKQFQLPSNRATPVDPLMPDFRKVRLVAYDYARFGKATERMRLIGRWERQVMQQAR